MSYTNVVAGIMERLATLSATLKVSLDYEPTGIHETPAAYVLYGGTRGRTTAGQVTVMPYEVRIRLLNKWQSNKECEAQLMPFVNSIPAAIDADAQLGGRITSGLAAVTDVEEGYIILGGVEYRRIDFLVHVVDKGPYGSGI